MRSRLHLWVEVASPNTPTSSDDAGDLSCRLTTAGSCAKLPAVIDSWRQHRTGGILLLALVGAWLSHTALYVETRGVGGLRAELLGSPHLYMLPAAGLLVAATFALISRWWRLWQELGGRLLALRGDVAPAALRGAAMPRLPRRWPLRDGGEARLPGLWLAVAPLQLILYVLQENLEAASVHQAAPGISLLWADHWLAVVVHAVTALVLCALAALLIRRVARRETELVLRVRLLRLLFLESLAAVRAAVGAAPQPPLDRFGCQLWSRPPPQPAGR